MGGVRNVALGVCQIEALLVGWAFERPWEGSQEVRLSFILLGWQQVVDYFP